MISVVLFVIGLVALSLASAATVHAVAQHYLHQEIDVARCYARAWGKVISLIVDGILVILALGGAVILSFIIIGIPLFFYLAVSWSVFVPAIVLDGETATGALGRSRTLVKGSWWRVFGISIVLWFIVFGLYVAVFIALEIVGLFNTAVGNILSSAATILIFPIFPIALTLLYIDLRVRKEQYSLRMMTSEVGPEMRRPDNLPRRDR